MTFVLNSIVAVLFYTLYFVRFVGLPKLAVHKLDIAFASQRRCLFLQFEI